MDGWAGEQAGGMDGWMNGWMGGWKDGWMDGRTEIDFIMGTATITLCAGGTQS